MREVNMFLGKIIAVGAVWMMAEERNESNDKKSDEELTYLFFPENVRFLNKENIEEGDNVWFSLVKPCGGKETVDTIKKPIFPCS